jgi:uncharacterized membrane protein
MRKKFPVKRNITNVERRIRGILGLVVFLIPIMLPIEFEGINWFPVLAVILWLSGLFGRCPFTDVILLLQKLANQK